MWLACSNNVKRFFSDSCFALIIASAPCSLNGRRNFERFQFTSGQFLKVSVEEFIKLSTYFDIMPNKHIVLYWHVAGTLLLLINAYTSLINYVNTLLYSECHIRIYLCIKCIHMLLFYAPKWDIFTIVWNFNKMFLKVFKIIL